MSYHIPDGIETLIFDLGQVIVDLDVPRVVDGFARYASVNRRDIEAMVHDQDILHSYETGRLSCRSFAGQVCQVLGMELDFESFKSIWNSMLAGIPEGKLDLLRALRPKYRTMVLSNTNAMHLEAFDKMVDALYPGRTMSDFVDFAYYSHLIRMRKPDIKIFQYVLQKHHLDPVKTMFFDDKTENIEAAKLAGIQAFQVHHPDDLYQFFDDEE